MEEAEVLGDTIAILANGRVHCSGSPLELKRKIGQGYVLKLCISRDQIKDEILQIIQQNMPASKILVLYSKYIQGVNWIYFFYDSFDKFRP